MGLKLKIQLLAFIIILTVLVLITSGPLFLIIKLVFLNKSDLSILFIGLMVYTYGVTMQTIFFFFSIGPLGMILFIALNLTQAILTSIVFLEAIPAPASYLFTMMLPAQGINLLCKLYLSMENKKEDGLNWSNYKA